MFTSPKQLVPYTRITTHTVDKSVENQAEMKKKRAFLSKKVLDFYRK